MSDDPILAREAELLKAMASNDVEALDDLLDDDLVFTGLGGVVLSKQDDLEAHRARRLRLTRVEPSGQRVLRYGATAVVNVLLDMTGTFGGDPFEGAFRYTRVWHDRGGNWRVVAGHMSAAER
ncbi:MAG: nuclear transport factor 2 family protein [Bacteroidota bacterium]